MASVRRLCQITPKGCETDADDPVTGRAAFVFQSTNTEGGAGTSSWSDDGVAVDRSYDPRVEQLSRRRLKTLTTRSLWLSDRLG